MVVHTDRGFTIIEVMLFLAITGGLFAALMVGVNTGITQQRYLDSVRSYKALVQNQYSEVLNTRNEDGVENWKCSEDAGTQGSIVDGARGTRGTSQCVILGRAIQVDKDSNGKQIITSSVTGWDNSNTDTALNDVTAIKNYQPKLATFDKESTELDWGAHLTSVTVTGTPRTKSTAVILILRSPTTGTIRAFTSSNALNNLVDLSSLITDANSSVIGVMKNCVDGESGLLPKQSITIDPRIASADAVTADGDKTEGCE